MCVPIYVPTLYYAYTLVRTFYHNSWTTYYMVNIIILYNSIQGVNYWAIELL